MVNNYRVILISHNRLAEGVLTAVKMIAGNQTNIQAYGLMPGQNPDEKIKEIEASIIPNIHTLILADLFGGSMANSAARLSVKPNVRLITGLNLALALQAALEKPWTDKQIEKLINGAQENIKEVHLDLELDDDEENFF